MSSVFTRLRLRTVDATTVPSAALVPRAAVKLPSTEYLPLAVKLPSSALVPLSAVDVEVAVACGVVEVAAVGVVEVVVRLSVSSMLFSIIDDSVHVRMAGASEYPRGPAALQPLIDASLFQGPEIKTFLIDCAISRMHSPFVELSGMSSSRFSFVFVVVRVVFAVASVDVVAAIVVEGSPLMIANVRGGSSPAGHQRAGDWQMPGGRAPAGHHLALVLFVE